ncbi:hypothetical protein HY968_02070 [Candidatus Kaiserbacteria bacterium]|nr:hypothetical protein [Candidatus Kaiserbacteria bacterium]
MRKIIGVSTLVLANLALPVAVLAQATTGTGAGLFGALSLVAGFLNGLIGILITLAIIVFFWGLVQYLVNVGEQKSEGLKIMFYGLIAIFVMVSIWGILRIMQATFGISSTASALVPRAVPPPSY